VSVSEILELFRQAETAKKPSKPSGSGTPATSASVTNSIANLSITTANPAFTAASSSSVPPNNPDRIRQDALNRIRNEHALNDESV
jgi:hypothetical protein